MHAAAAAVNRACPAGAATVRKRALIRPARRPGAVLSDAAERGTEKEETG